MHIGFSNVLACSANNHIKNNCWTSKSSLRCFPLFLSLWLIKFDTHANGHIPASGVLCLLLWWVPEILDGMIKFCWQNVGKLSHLHVFKMDMADLWKYCGRETVLPLSIFLVPFQRFCPFLNLRHNVFFIWRENQVYFAKSKDLI